MMCSLNMCLSLGSPEKKKSCAAAAERAGGAVKTIYTLGFSLPGGKRQSMSLLIYGFYALIRQLQRVEKVEKNKCVLKSNCQKWQSSSDTGSCYWLSISSSARVFIRRRKYGLVGSSQVIVTKARRQPWIVAE